MVVTVKLKGRERLEEIVFVVKDLVSVPLPVAVDVVLGKAVNEKEVLQVEAVVVGVKVWVRDVDLESFGENEVETVTVLVLDPVEREKEEVALSVTEENSEGEPEKVSEDEKLEVGVTEDERVAVPDCVNVNEAVSVGEKVMNREADGDLVRDEVAEKLEKVRESLLEKVRVGVNEELAVGDTEEVRKEV